VGSLTMTVPLVPDGAVPWRIDPVGVDEIRDVKRVPAGTQITLSEFDTTAAIVFTSDVGPKGKIVRWQDFTRNKLAGTAAGWARQQAVEQYNKTLIIYKQILASGGPAIPEAGELFLQAKKAITLASEYTDNNQPDVAFREARRALRPLRVLMRACWTKAAETLNTPTASPYAVSFYSLPKHWELAKFIQQSRPGGNGLAYPGFDLNAEVDGTDGAAVASLPGWTSRKVILDEVVGTASIVNSKGLEDPPPQPGPFPTARIAVPGRPVLSEQDVFEMKPKPNLGSHSLRLTMYPKPDPEKPTKPGEPVPYPMALERSFVSVDSPSAEFAPGTWVRISFWLKTTFLLTSADGLMVSDSVGGEPLALRMSHAPTWQRQYLYRQVPASGKISLSFALTGIGSAHIDDVAIEPMTPFGAMASQKPPGPDAPKPLDKKQDENKLPFPRQTDPLPLPRPAGR
jgi:hypothetical protein